MFATIVRVFKFAFQDFFRNIWLSIVTVTILVLALSTINVLIIVNTLTNKAVDLVQDKIDITVNFKPEISEEQIMNVKSYFESLNQVQQVTYVSKDEALKNFREKNKNSPKILETLDELGDNPLGASLIIQAKTADDYPTLLEVLQGKNYESMIEDKNFEDHKTMISQITSITRRISRTGLVMAIIFSLISILIIFNAIRVTIYTHREEIQTMKLVGATNTLVSAPFVLVGIFYAIFALGISLLILYPFLGFIQPQIVNFFESESFNIVYYFNDNFWLIFGSELLASIVLVVISSSFAIRKYLKI